VGIVEKSRMLDGSQLQVGDIAIALASTGVHSNGLSLVRKIVSDRGFSWSARPESLDAETIGETFLKPTRIYVKPVLAALKAGLDIHGMAHITGGGLPENLPRSLGNGQAIKIDPSSWTIPPVFQWLAEAGAVSPEAMYNTFNMGIGFVLLVPPHQVEQTITHFQSQDIPTYVIGEVITGSGELVGLYP
jgi:phosphoribosylformylglycinamidine cyclo-ligase